MAKVKQAIRPNFIDNYRKIEPKREVDEKTLLVEEKDLGYLASTKGWVVLKEYIEALMNELDITIKKGMENGQSFEAIGQNAVVSEVAKEYLARIIDKVSDAKESREKQKET